MKPRIFLFQHLAYLGGVWHATCNLVEALYKTNQRRGELDLYLGLASAQEETAELFKSCPELKIERLECVNVWGFQLIAKYGTRIPSVNPFRRYTFFKPSKLAMDADMWVAMVDRFRRPLAPLRPYGVLIHDMIHKYSPESFSPSFMRKSVRRGIAPTVRRARFQVTTTTATAHDVLDYYGTSEQSMCVLPVAHSPAHRFDHLSSQSLDVSAKPYFLNICNLSPHKGCYTMIEGYIKWRSQRPENMIRLVVCGCDTKAFSPQAPDNPSPYVGRVRDLLRRSGLVEGVDVLFLGYVNDAALKHLYEHATALVNSARFDNGSYSMIEAAWFGTPVISSDYPAARYVDARFGLSSLFFRVNHAESLAVSLDRVCVSAKTPRDLSAVRTRLSNSELSPELFAERFYQMLVEQSRTNK